MAKSRLRHLVCAVEATTRQARLAACSSAVSIADCGDSGETVSSLAATLPLCVLGGEGHRRDGPSEATQALA